MDPKCLSLDVGMAWIRSVDAGFDRFGARVASCRRASLGMHDVVGYARTTVGDLRWAGVYHGASMCALILGLTIARFYRLKHTCCVMTHDRILLPPPPSIDPLSKTRPVVLTRRSTLHSPPPHPQAMSTDFEEHGLFVYQVTQVRLDG